MERVSAEKPSPSMGEGWVGVRARGARCADSVKRIMLYSRSSGILR